jgi:hypothetical protein
VKLTEKIEEIKIDAEEQLMVLAGCGRFDSRVRFGAMEKRNLYSWAGIKQQFLSDPASFPDQYLGRIILDHSTEQRNE